MHQKIVVWILNRQLILIGREALSSDTSESLTTRCVHRTNGHPTGSTLLASFHAYARTHFLSFGHLLRRRGLSSFCRKTAKGGEETRPDQLIRSCAHTGGRSNVDWHPPSRAASQRATLPRHHPLTTALSAYFHQHPSLLHVPLRVASPEPWLSLRRGFLVLSNLPFFSRSSPLGPPDRPSPNLRRTLTICSQPRLLRLLFMPYKVFTCKSETSKSGACFARKVFCL